MSAAAGWQPVALAADIEPGTSAGTRLHGQELVVWRDEAGAVHVWEDRCPHRGMRLSFGFVRGDHIACLYHGWRFDAAGRCRFIPAHPQLDVPATITVNRFATAERLGIVWVSLGNAVAAGTPPGHNNATTPVRSLAVDVAPDRVVAALATARSPFDDAAPTAIGREGPLVTFEAGVDRLFAAIQPVAPDRTTVHLAIAGPASTPERRRVSQWAEAWRDALEAAHAPLDEDAA